MTTRKQAGFSLVEMLIVIATIGVLAALAIPTIGPYRDRAKVLTTAANFRTFADAFSAYYHLEGSYPPDSHNAVPRGVGMEWYLQPIVFEREAPIGGRYNWEGPNNYSYVGISLTTTSATQDQLQYLDRILDNGDLSTGFFRLMPNGRYTYVIEEL